MNYEKSEKERTIEEWNTYIFDLLKNQSEPTVLGLLPLSKEESDIIVNAIHKTETKKESLLAIPAKRAVTAYAMAYALSQTKQGSAKKHWEQINEKLNIGAASSWDSNDPYSKFPNAIDKIAQQASNLSNKKIGKNVPSVNFQAGIKRCWTSELKVRLKQINGHHSLPGLNDTEAIKRYALKLAELGSTQQLLSMALESELGVMLVRRLIYFEDGKTDKLPDFLIEIFKATKEGRKRRSSHQIREPYLVFDSDARELKLHFPKLNTSFETTWVYNGVPSSVSSYRQRIEKVSFNEDIQVELRREDGSSDRIIKRSTQLNDATPFRLYRENDGKEILVNYNSIEKIPSGHYYVIMNCDVDAGEDQKYCLVYQDGKIGEKDAPIAISPNFPPLKLRYNEREYCIECTDAVTVRLDESQPNVIHLWEEKLPLVFGMPIIQLNQSDDTTLQIAIFSSEGGEIVVKSGGHQTALENYLSQLSDRVHEIRISIIEGYTSLPVRFLYWNRIKSYDLSGGKIEVDKLADLPPPKGFTILSNTLYFDSADLSPYVVITTKRGRRLRIPKNGVIASIHCEDEEPRVLNANAILSVGEKDERKIMFQVFGQEKVVITNKQTGEKLITLTPRKRGERGKGANKKPYTLQYLKEKAPNQILLANGKELMTIQLPHVTLDPVKWSSGKYVFQLPLDDITEIAYKDNCGQRVTLSTKSNQWRKGEASLYDEAIQITGFNPKQGAYFKIEITLDQRKLPFGRNGLSFEVFDSSQQWKTLQTYSNESTVELDFCFWGSRYDKAQDTHDKIRSEYLAYYKYLQSSPVLDVLDIFPSNFYKYNLKADYINQSLGHRKTREEWWGITVDDLSLLSELDYSVGSHQQYPYCFEINPTCLSVSSKDAFIGNENFISRTLNLQSTNTLMEGLREFKTPYSFDLPSFMESIQPNEEVERYFESYIEELLSAAHLGYCLYMLQKRVSSLCEMEDENVQSDLLDAYERVIAEKNRDYEKLYTKLGYITFPKDQLWSPYKKPRKRKQLNCDTEALERVAESLEERTLYRVSVLCWWLAFYSRLAAANAFDNHDQSIQQDFVYRVDAVFEKRETLTLILSLAPELYAFYSRLFHETLITE